MRLVSRLNRWVTGKLNKDIPEDRQFALDIADIITDLECRIEHEYRDTLMYPGQQRRYERDRAVIVRVKRALGLTATEQVDEMILGRKLSDLPPR